MHMTISDSSSRPVTPCLAADVIIEMVDLPGHPIVLIERKFEPFGWAIPGGFVDVGETVEQAAIREMKEEVCLDVSLIHLLGVYSDPSRDHRGHTVTVVYVGRASGEKPVAADDAKTVGIFTPDDFPEAMAFDHAQGLRDYLHFKKTGEFKPVVDYNLQT